MMVGSHLDGMVVLSDNITQQTEGGMERVQLDGRSKGMSLSFGERFSCITIKCQDVEALY